MDCFDLAVKDWYNCCTEVDSPCVCFDYMITDFISYKFNKVRKSNFRKLYSFKRFYYEMFRVSRGNSWRPAMERMFRIQQSVISSIEGGRVKLDIAYLSNMLGSATVEDPAMFVFYDASVCLFNRPNMRLFYERLVTNFEDLVFAIYGISCELIRIKHEEYSRTYCPEPDEEMYNLDHRYQKCGDEEYEFL